MSLESKSTLKRLSGMRQHRFAHCRVLTMLAIGMLVGDAPELACKKSSIHVKRFMVRITGPTGNVMQLEVGKSGHPDYSVFWLQSWRGARFVFDLISGVGCQ